jgi:transcriptional regulator with XRE-family HTH domain
MGALKVTTLRTHGEAVAEESGRDDEFRRDWERLSLARAVAAKVIVYRSEHGLSQRDLAKRLGMTQPQVARLENGEHEPAQSTLMRLASGLGMEFNISITAAGRAPVLLTRRAREQASARFEADDAVVRFSAV